MKKTFLAFLGLILLTVTIHVSTPFYGGVPGIVSRIQARVVNKTAEVVHDPGACALIRGYWWRGLYARLRDKCVTNYIQNVVDEVGDCKKTQLIADMSTLSRIWLRDEYRYACLIRHYKAMLGNSLTSQWLPPVCLEARDDLVVMLHYLQDIRLSRINNKKTTTGPALSQEDISLIDQCEWFLDTPQIYAFLRDDAYIQDEAAYIESQKSREFKFR